MYKVTGRDGQPVTKGDVVTDFRGKQWIFQSVTGSEKIWVKDPNVKLMHRDKEFFPEVLGISLEEV